MARLIGGPGVQLGMRKFGLIGTSALALLAASATSAQMTAAPPPAADVSSSVPADVAAFYSAYTIPQIWFRGGVDNPAVGQLAAILQRAPFDGFTEGPQLAAQVRAAGAQARTGGPEAVAAAERTLSASWVRYVQA